MEDQKLIRKPEETLSGGTLVLYTSTNSKNPFLKNFSCKMCSHGLLRYVLKDNLIVFGFLRKNIF